MTTTPAGQAVLARAEKRLVPMIARRGIDAEVLAVAGMYERMFAAATAAPEPAAATVDDLTAVVDAIRDEISAEPLPTWPAGGGYSPSGNSWVCPEPGCGFGVAGLNSPTPEGEYPSDPVGEHLAEHEKPVVSPELLANARAEVKAEARRLVMDRWADVTNRLPEDVQGVTS